MQSLNILITNNTLGVRAGSELYVYDLAVELLKIGHKPIACSDAHGQIADELRAATVPVVRDFKKLTIKPDIIHGQHALDTLAALSYFSDTPAIYICHGWMPWEELPPIMSRIIHYIAVDETCKDRLIIEEGIPEANVSTLLNFVNLERFNKTRTLNETAKSALVFSNYASIGTYIEAIANACQMRGIKLDIVGSSYNNGSINPEEILPQYDIVFAKAKCALEAIAVGNAVIVCDSRGLGEMVGFDNYDRFRKLNFGIRALQSEVSVNNILTEIDKYSAEATNKLSLSVRDQFCHKIVVNKLLKIYHEAIHQYQSIQKISPETELKEISENLIRHKASIHNLRMAPHIINNKNLLLQNKISEQVAIINNLKTNHTHTKKESTSLHEK